MTGILLIHLMMMMNPMIMISGPILIDTSGDGNKLNDIEYEFVYTEKDTMGDVGVVYMEQELCPTGGLDNILRFEKTVDSGGDVHVQVRVNEGSGDVQDLVAEEGSAVLVQIPGDDRLVAAKVPEGADTAPVDEGDSIHVQTSVGEEGGGALADEDTVDDGDVMDKHVDKEGIVQGNTS